ncbi:DUF3710 domain-containing protein [Lipingzhangella sp. LS1_29]|uniref:DUF3710 domain-containing protein n=1 Tax=Lipingzhangella rawalii TaxID=2055835 RepID=A0ABU2H0K1_9ACTN|nr:DUF3710 domain-containing protein [Lipingzhangella rawalii]MDS1268829.1 DUF3710 domain-containing protein [Lipingzhangella rawalii]
MFGRRRKKQKSQQTDAREIGIVDVPEELRSTPAEPNKPADVFRGQGPWDAAEDVPEVRRIDFGSLRVPVVSDIQLQVNMSKKKEQVVGVTLVSGKTMLQVIPLAAPKSTGLWEELRSEIQEELTKAKAQIREFEGTFGPEVRAVIPVPGKTNDSGNPVGRPVRYFGVDGPRWLLRGIMRGEGALDPRVAARIEEVFQGIVVVRGENPLPPRERLPLKLPPETRAGIKRAREQAAQEDSSGDASGGEEAQPEAIGTDQDGATSASTVSTGAPSSDGDAAPRADEGEDEDAARTRGGSQ